MSDLQPSVAATSAAPPSTPIVPPASRLRGLYAVVLLLGLVATAAVALAWRAQQRIQAVEQELVRRQQDSAAEAVEARVLAKQSQETSREAAAKVAVIETRVAEVTQQRGQLEDLIQSLSRSRDENLVADIDASLRLALQQAALTGSAAPLVSALKAADERLARVAQPRLDGVRRAIVRDLDRIKATGVADIAALAVRLDEAGRLADDAPLQVIEPVRPDLRADRPNTPARSAAAARVTNAPEPAASSAAAADWHTTLDAAWRRVWAEAVGLLRVTRIDQPQALLLAPEQSYFLRENLKLRLLNARLGLLARQFDTVQADLQASLAAIDAHFDRQARKTQQLTELLRGVAAQARQVVLPRPDDTLAALAVAAAGR